MRKFLLNWVGSGRKAAVSPNPDYPYGKAMSLATDGQPSCTVKLPYPAPEVGKHVIRCTKCDLIVAVTAAGRTDDPTQVTLPCKRLVHQKRAT